MKPRLCRSSWRAFASTHPLTLPSTFPREVEGSPREAFLACPAFPPWNPPTLLSLWSSPSSFYTLALIFLVLAKVWLSLALALSPPYDLVLWTNGSVPFPFGKSGSDVLAGCSLFVAPRPLFPCQQAQYAQASLIKPAPLCNLFAGFGSTNKSTTSLLFSSYLTLVFSSPPYPLLHLFFHLNLSGRN